MPTQVYVFRDASFSRGGDTIVCAAPSDLVIAVFGGGGTFEADGLGAAFGGSAVFKNNVTGQTFLGVWGARKASRFRNQIRASGVALRVKNEPPPAHLIARFSR